jgi:2-haloacid dehalogenase
MTGRQIFAFDAYGTLFDVHSAAARHRDAIGPEWERLSEVWRTKQLEYTWVRAACGRYQSFRQITAMSLDYAIAVSGGVPQGVRDQLLESYATLAAYAEVPAALGALKARGARLAILSNGDLDMLDEAVAAAGLGNVFEALLSVSVEGTYKPIPRVYALATEVMGAAGPDITFVSSNRWDVAGAAAFGLSPVWVNRSGRPDEYPDLPPVRVLRDLAELPRL